jgi:5-hydroxyisourate hydrolase-like protein (transthyretin family)
LLSTFANYRIEGATYQTINCTAICNQERQAARMRFLSPRLLALWRLLALFPVLFCLSCSSAKYNPVRGKVLYKNEPIENVVVTFHPKGKDKLAELPKGVTEEDGSFSVNTGKGEGAPEGEYVVTFYCPAKVEEKPGKKVKPKGMVMQSFQFEDRFKGAYTSEAKSNFNVSIKPGKNELEPFNLK